MLASLLRAFLVGGGICLVVQIFIDLTALTPARILTALVVLGVFLGAVGFYQPLVDFAGAGASVPLPGFGNLLAQGVKEEIDASGAIGILTGGMKAASAGLTAAIFFSFIAGLLGKSRN